MSTPNPEVLFVFDGVTGLPYTGVATDLSFVKYIDDTGASVTAPTISKVTDGIFKFTPVFSGHAIYYMIATGESPAYVYRYMRPEDVDSDDSVSAVLDAVTTLLDIETGKWKIFTSGDDANRLVIYEPDGTTVLMKFDLLDSSGSATSSSPFSRVPV